MQLKLPAEQDWEQLLEKQSTTLSEAVAEYKRRYNRPPPKGFDRWYVPATLPKLLLITNMTKSPKVQLCNK